MRKQCKECKYNRRDWTNLINPDHYCYNRNSPSYGYNIRNTRACSEFVERGRA